jgi:hypothetical protein
MALPRLVRKIVRATGAIAVPLKVAGTARAQLNHGQRDNSNSRESDLVFVKRTDLMSWQ